MSIKLYRKGCFVNVEEKHWQINIGLYTIKNGENKQLDAWLSRTILKLQDWVAGIESMKDFKHIDIAVPHIVMVSSRELMNEAGVDILDLVAHDSPVKIELLVNNGVDIHEFIFTVPIIYILKGV